MHEKACLKCFEFSKSFLITQASVSARIAVLKRKGRCYLVSETSLNSLSQVSFQFKELYDLYL